MLTWISWGFTSLSYGEMLPSLESLSEEHFIDLTLIGTSSCSGFGSPCLENWSSVLGKHVCVLQKLASVIFISVSVLRFTEYGPGALFPIALIVLFSFLSVADTSSRGWDLVCFFSRAVSVPSSFSREFWVTTDFYVQTQTIWSR